MNEKNDNAPEVQQTELPPEYRGVTDVLRSWPDAPAPDLAERVLAATRPAPWRQPLAIAAGLLLLLGTLWFIPSRTTEPLQLASTTEPDAAQEWMAAPPAPEPAQPVSDLATDVPTPALKPNPLDQATAWLMQVQDSNGGWSMGHAGAAANYTVGLSALALLALQTGDQMASAAHAEALQSGMNFLVTQQDPYTGLFGPDITGSLYNHTLACLALLAIQPGPDASDYAASLQAGLDLLVRHQRPEGGWNYLRARGSPSNSSLTSWALLVLMEAEARGVARHSAEIARGLAWLQTTIDDKGRAGYRRPGDHPHGSETLTAAAALCLSSQANLPPALRELMLANVRSDASSATHSLDYYRTYLQAAALREAGMEDAPEMNQLAARLENAQDHTSEQAGSWSSDDPWARTGGRVYSTALAMLVLRDD
jgi:HAMP domain-containing protein